MTLLNITSAQQPEGKPSPCESRQGEQIRCVRPQYRIHEQDTSYVAEVDLPGVPKGSVELSVADGVLEIAATRSWLQRSEWSPLAGVSEDGVNYRLRLELGDELDSETISAELADGRLTLTFAKAEEKKPRRIAID